MKLDKITIICLFSSVVIVGLSWFIKTSPYVFDAVIVSRGLPIPFWGYSSPGFLIGPAPEIKPVFRLIVAILDVLIVFGVIRLSLAKDRKRIIGFVLLFLLILFIFFLLSGEMVTIGMK